MKINKGYIIGKGDDFFGKNYSELLEIVFNNINLIDDSYQIILSKNRVDNVTIIENDNFLNQNSKKEKILENNNIVQFWYQTKTDNIIGINDLSFYCYYKLKEFYSKDYMFGNPIFDLSLYNKNCFIQNHKDGYDNDQKRLCVILLYLNKDWEKGMGGELVITDLDGNKIEIEPKFGNFAILDFTSGNLEHEVKKITSDIFNRQTLISFMTKENVL
jgi:hypothetical protein